MTSFQSVQRQFSQSIRRPERARPANEDEARRLAIYQSLFFNNIMNFLSSGFPVIFGILTEEQSEALVRRFFAEHHCRSPYFAKISQEFVEYLSSGPGCLEDYPDWLPELAHYEWMELDISIRKPISPVRFWKGENIPDFVDVSPLASLVSYEYPVHLIGPDFTLPEASDTRHYYVIYRSPEDDVAFMMLNPLTAMLLNMLEQAEEALMPEEIVAGLCERVPSLTLQQLESGAYQTITAMLNCGILISGD